MLVALASAAVMFGLWYAAPYRQLLDVGPIYLLVLAVDVVCGPLLTLILASPAKSRRERWLDFSLIQLAALAHGMHSVPITRSCRSTSGITKRLIERSRKPSGKVTVGEMGVTILLADDHCGLRAGGRALIFSAKSAAIAHLASASSS